MQSLYVRQVAFLSAVLKDYFGAARGLKVLDWGCGKGQITYLLAGHGFEVTSCDLVAEKNDSSFGQEVPIIEDKGITVVPLRHPERLPFDDASFDCVVSFGVLEHVYSDQSSLRELRRTLKPGGVAFITLLPYFLSWTQALGRAFGNRYHDRLYNKGSLRKLAGDAHFELAGVWHGQLFPKNSVPIGLDPYLEPLDRFLCGFTPLKYLATNLEAVLIAS